MSALTVLLVDDEPLALRRLETLFGDIDDVAVIGTASTGGEAEERIAVLKPDLVMLDISMPQKSGIRVAADLVANPRPEIIFVTAFEQYAPDAFEVDAADYLLKPVRFDRLRQAMERAKRRRELGERGSTASFDARAIWVQTRTGSVRVPLSDIDWIEAAKDYVLLHTSTRSYLHRSTMSALEAELEGAGLLRVHRSAFIRASRVREVRGHGRAITALVIGDDLEVPVGSTYALQVIEALKLSS